MMELDAPGDGPSRTKFSSKHQCELSLSKLVRSGYSSRGDISHDFETNLQVQNKLQ